MCTDPNNQGVKEAIQAPSHLTDFASQRMQEIY